MLNIESIVRDIELRPSKPIIPDVIVPFADHEVVLDLDNVLTFHALMCDRLGLDVDRNAVMIAARIAKGYLEKEGIEARMRMRRLFKEDIYMRQYLPEDIGRPDVVGLIHGFSLRPEWAASAMRGSPSYLLPRKVYVNTALQIIGYIPLVGRIVKRSDRSIMIAAYMPCYILHIPNSPITKIDNIDLNKVDILGIAFELPEKFSKRMK